MRYASGSCAPCKSSTAWSANKSNHERSLLLAFECIEPVWRALLLCASERLVWSGEFYARNFYDARLPQLVSFGFYLFCTVARRSDTILCAARYVPMSNGFDRIVLCVSHSFGEYIEMKLFYTKCKIKVQKKKLKRATIVNVLEANMTSERKIVLKETKEKKKH